MKKLLLVLLGLILVVIVAGFVLSPEIKLDKSVVINAPMAKVHEYVGDLKNWPSWAPWTDPELGGDASIVTKYGPTTTGVGAHQSWTGKDGDGDLTFTKCDPETGIAYDMVFINGEERMPAHGTLTYKKVDGGVEVTWGMDSKMDKSCAFGLVRYGSIMGAVMKPMIGGMFEKGLAKLKKTVEAAK